MDWLIIGTFFLGFCALVAPYISGFTERTFFAPNLRFLFKLDSPYCHMTTAGNTLVYYFRFRIENSYRGFLFTAFDGAFLRNVLCKCDYDIHFPLNRSYF